MLADKIRAIYTKVFEKIGIDRIAHFSLCGFVVACAGIFGWLPALIAFVAMWILSVAKEAFDAQGDKLDIVAGVIGGMLAMVISVIGFLI